MTAGALVSECMPLRYCSGGRKGQAQAQMPGTGPLAGTGVGSEARRQRRVSHPAPVHSAHPAHRPHPGLSPHPSLARPSGRWLPGSPGSRTARPPLSLAVPHTHVPLRTPVVGARRARWHAGISAPRRSYDILMPRRTNPRGPQGALPLTDLRAMALCYLSAYGSRPGSPCIHPHIGPRHHAMLALTHPSIAFTQARCCRRQSRLNRCT